MERTKILYRKTKDGRIAIVDIQGAAPMKDLPKEYLDGKPSYRRAIILSAHGVAITVLTEQRILFEHNGLIASTKNHAVTVGAVFTEEEFSRLIATMKAAGDRLIRICKERDEVKTVVI